MLRQHRSQLSPYFWDQLDKHRMTDPIEGILQWYEKHSKQNKTYTHNNQLTAMQLEKVQVTQTQEFTQTQCQK